MYAAISTANPFLTQTNGPRYETRDFLQIFARSICRLIHARHEIEHSIRFKCIDFADSLQM